MRVSISDCIMGKKCLYYIIVIGLFLLFFTGISASEEKKADDVAGRGKVRQITLSVTSSSYDPVRYGMGLLIAENWRKLGFDVKLVAMDWATISKECLNRKDFDAFILHWSGRAERIDPDSFCYSIAHSSQADAGGFNVSGYSNEEYDRYAEAQRYELDTEKRKQLVWKCQEIIARDQPFTPIVTRNRLNPYNDRDWTGWTPMMGEGLQSFWNMMNVKPQTGRINLRWGYLGDIRNMNPMTSMAAHDFQTQRLIYDTLIRINTNGMPVLWAAEDYKIINEKTFDVSIRKGMKFHDGYPVTSKDIKFSFEFPGKVNSSYFANILYPFRAVEIIDEYTVRFHIHEASATFIANCLGNVFILPEHIWSRISNPLEYSNDKPIGSGPFKLVHWRRNEEIKLSRFEGHFNPPHYENLIKKPYPNVQSMVAAVQNDECDFGGWYIEPVHADLLKKKTKHAKTIIARDHGFYHVNYNVRRTPFNDPALRKAMAAAIPKNQILDSILEGNGEILDSSIAPVNGFYYDPNIPKHVFSLEKARQILKDAGYAWDKNGKIYYPFGKHEDVYLRSGDDPL